MGNNPSDFEDISQKFEIVEKTDEEKIADKQEDIRSLHYKAFRHIRDGKDELADRCLRESRRSRPILRRMMINNARKKSGINEGGSTGSTFEFMNRAQSGEKDIRKKIREINSDWKDLNVKKEMKKMRKLVKKGRGYTFS